MWKFTFCPNFKAKAFPFVMSCVLAVVYVACLIWIAISDTEELEYNVLLGPDIKIVDYGARNPWKIVNDY